MITKAQFAEIETEVTNSLNEMFDYILTNCSFDSYLFFLGDGEYKAEMQNINVNPYVIDYITDIRMDRNRMQFWTQFAREHYSFDGYDVVNNDSYRTHLEMMIYTHLWESEHSLKRLYRLSELVTTGNYAWKVTVPPMGKHEFIRTDIRSRFDAKGLSIGTIIKNGYHSSLRNAFAHSQYYYNDGHQEIELLNYGGAAWELKEISLDNWSKRFTYSIWLNYLLHTIVHQRRTAITNLHNRSHWTVTHPVNDTTTHQVVIEYTADQDAFSFRQ